jgi:hypothetical protein
MNPTFNKKSIINNKLSEGQINQMKKKMKSISLF